MVDPSRRRVARAADGRRGSGCCRRRYGRPVDSLLSAAMSGRRRPAGTITQTPRGASAWPRGRRALGALAPSPARPLTAAGLTSKATQRWPSFIRRRTMFAPIGRARSCPAASACPWASSPPEADGRLAGYARGPTTPDSASPASVCGVHGNRVCQASTAPRTANTSSP